MDARCRRSDPAPPGNALARHVLHKEKYEVPADDYVVVEFPSPKALVTGCLFNKPLTYWEVVNTRKTSLAAFLGDSKLDIAWLVPTNSIKAGGFEDLCTRAMLTETLEKGMKPDQVADRLQARSVADLRGDLDALAKEFSARPGRSPATRRRRATRGLAGSSWRPRTRTRSSSARLWRNSSPAPPGRGSGRATAATP